LKVIKCADEGGVCYTGLDRNIVYASNNDRNRAKSKAYPTGQPITCNNKVFGDPHPGVKKSCYTKVL
jgi:hypothetical protein